MASAPWIKPGRVVFFIDFNFLCVCLISVLFLPRLLRHATSGTARPGTKCRWQHVISTLGRVGKIAGNWPRPLYIGGRVCNGSNFIKIYCTLQRRKKKEEKLLRSINVSATRALCRINPWTALPLALPYLPTNFLPISLSNLLPPLAVFPAH